jgi:hypothetical protein
LPALVMRAVRRASEGEGPTPLIDDLLASLHGSPIRSTISPPER